MASTSARKFFSRRVSLTGGTAISYAALMRSASAVTGTPVWGLSSDGNPSMDSFIGDGATVIPATATLYIGYDAQVANADAAATYTGVPVSAATPFNLQDFTRGPVDTNAVFLFSVGTQNVDLIFQGL